MGFLELSVMNQEKHEDGKNKEFYDNCTTYFEFMRKKGRTDYNFEDEYYFTMPAISNH